MAQIIVSSGQSSSGLTISGGDTLLVESGGLVQDTHLLQSSTEWGGVELVYGSSIRTQIDFGSQTVESGGFSISAVVSSNDGYQNIRNGGSASFSTLQGGAEVDVAYDDYNDVDDIDHSALAVVTSDTVESGGALYVYSQGIVSGTVVLSQGSIDVYSGGVASGDTISSGGLLIIEKNGSAVHEIVQSGGLILEKPGAIISDTDTDGVLAGLVVIDNNNTLISSWAQSGDRVLNDIRLSATSSSNFYGGGNVILAAGEVARACRQLNGGLMKLVLPLDL
ncbi:hypothetical protein [Acetobacter persici]|uniref:Uncharacterized protein n=1 Tax=Acetobacter persici TaxID=1076596 RepID=A0A6V8IGX0_9PROT|nr:hypothetical protein [Acetobacter persici]GFE94535.1 hypothetical protein DmAi_25940 [Acetobacter persici]